jgi:hypothetical protein
MSSPGAGSLQTLQCAWGTFHKHLKHTIIGASGVLLGQPAECRDILAKLRMVHAASRSDLKKASMRTPGDVMALAWNPDGTRLLLSHRSGRVTVHDTRRVGRSNSSSRPPELLSERDLNWELNAMQFTPDGRTILAAYGDTTGGGVRLLAVRPCT